MQTNKAENTSPSEATLTLKTALRELADVLNSKGIEIKAFKSEKLLENLPQDRTIELIKNVKQQTKIYRDVEDSDSFDKYLWGGMRDLGWRVEDGLFSKLDSDQNIIEVYRKDLNQYCANYNFFRFISYPLEEIFCLRADELYSRDQEINKLFYQQVRYVLSGESQGTVSLASIPDHWSRESRSPKMLEALIHHKLLSPIKDKFGSVVGIIFVYQALQSRQQPRRQLQDETHIRSLDW